MKPHPESDLSNRKSLDNSSASQLVKAAVLAGFLSVLVGNAQWSVSASLKQKNTDHAVVLYGKSTKLSGDYGELNKTFLSLQKEERDARKSGAGMSWRFVRFEELRAPENPLSLFYNDANLLKGTLGKNLQEVAGVGELTDQNIEATVVKIFTSGNDQVWLRQTKYGKKISYSQEEYARYLQQVDGARLALYLRLQDSRFRAYAIERFNAFLPKLAAKGNIGSKTLQTVFTGIMALSDAMENAENIVRNGRSISTNPMAPFDQASQIARLVSLLGAAESNQIVRAHISIPDRGETLVYFISQRRPMTMVFGDTKQAFGVTPDVTVDLLVRGMKRAIDDTGKPISGK